MQQQQQQQQQQRAGDAAKVIIIKHITRARSGPSGSAAPAVSEGRAATHESSSRMWWRRHFQAAHAQQNIETNGYIER